MALGQRDDQQAMGLQDLFVGELAELAISATSSEQNAMAKVHVPTALVCIQSQLVRHFTN
jgi:hypothetical protein